MEKQELEKQIVSLWFNDNMLEASVLADNLPPDNPIRSAIEKRMFELGEWDMYGKGPITDAVPVDISYFQKFVLAIDIIKNLKGSLDLAEPKILDVGCYNGYFIKQLVKHVYCEAHGTDIFDMEGAYEPGIFLHKIHARDLSKHFPKQFDVVTCFDALEHMFDDTEAIRNIKAVTKDGATIIINLPKPKSLIIDDPYMAIETMDKPEHLRPYTEEYVKELFGDKRDLKFYDCQDETGNKTWFLTYRK